MIWHERRCTFPNFGRPACLFVTGLVMAVSSVTTFSETWGQAWAPQANPTSLMFQAAQGGPNPSSQAINLSKGTTDQRIWSSNENIAWLLGRFSSKSNGQVKTWYSRENTQFAAGPPSPLHAWGTLELFCITSSDRV